MLYGVQDRRFARIASMTFNKEGINLNQDELVTCDVTKGEDIHNLAGQLELPLDGLIFSIAYANPKTALREALWETPIEDVLQAFHASAIGFVSVVGRLVEADKFNPSASIVAMTFNSRRAYPNYGWMGPIKGALEVESSYLALALGPARGMRFNCISAGPQNTLAATNIPSFKDIGQVWNERSPLPWDLDTGRELVAGAAVYLLSDLSGVTGTVQYVDGGFNSVAFRSESNSLE